MKRFVVLLLLIIFGLFIFFIYSRHAPNQLPRTAQKTDENNTNEDALLDTKNPLSIDVLRKGKYPGSDITIEEKLEPGSNYNRYIASYKSEGLKIYALLTIPQGEKPKTGWPVIVFNHGFIPPQEYRTTERYIAYTDAFSRNGYIIFKSDYRGHGSSEGEATGGYGSNAYTIDVLNALASMKKYKDADPNRIGMWGHSMGGFITLRSMVVSKDIKAGVIWGGVVASYPDLILHWRRSAPTPVVTGQAKRWRQQLIDRYGQPSESSPFWRSISANFYLKDISGPLQLDHSIDDEEVPVEFSEKLAQEMKDAKKPVTLYTYPNDNHNISNNFTTAMDRSVAFMDKYVKGE